MKNCIKLSILLFIFLFPERMLSDHIVGGGVEYDITPLNDGTFLVSGRFIEYRNAVSGGSPFDYTKEIGVYRYNGIQWIFEVAFVTKTLQNIKAVRNIPGNIYCNQNSAIVTEFAEYPFEYILNAQNNTVMLAWQRCCREPDIINVLPSLGMVNFFTITQKGQVTKHSSPRIQNNFKSLTFVNEDNEISIFENTPQDVSYKFDWGIPKISGGTSLVPYDCNSPIPAPSKCLPPFTDIYYAEGFSHLMPFHITGSQSINTDTGHILFNSSLNGNFLTCIAYEVYSSNNKLSESSFDFAILVTTGNINYFFGGDRFYDKNGNSVKDVGETSFHFPIVKEGEDCGIQFDESGAYSLFLKNNQNVVFTSELPEWKINTTDSKITFTTPHPVFTDTVHIPFVPVISDVKKLNGYVVQDNLRCNEDAEIICNLSNTGTVANNVTVIMIIDSLLEITDFQSQPVINGDTIVWENLFIDVAQSLQLKGNVKLPNEMFTGQEINIHVTVKELPSNSVIDSFEYIRILECAVDPNDKQVSPSRTCLNLTKPEEYLYYTIRFENLGNAYAKDVIIVDSLSEMLDINTFEILESSHNHYYKLTDRHLEIYFPDIKLQPFILDSVKSKGQIIFRIKPTIDVPEGYKIYNTASIYFDRNEPIITNTTFNTIRSFISEDEPLSSGTGKILISPNPAGNDKIILLPEIWVLPLDVRVRIYNSTGKNIQNTDEMFGKPIDISHLGNGIFFLHLFHKGKCISALPLIKL
ncbi:MAG: T9SS type A sorting domain-containing protein [Saprospiraceae bacterium]|nr:T9SS type A sorting domain-containing protein [Saprospiraceae bacterium]